MPRESACARLRCWRRSRLRHHRRGARPARPVRGLQPRRLPLQRRRSTSTWRSRWPRPTARRCTRRSARRVRQLLRQHPGPLHRREQLPAGQGRRTAVNDWARFAFNSTFGLLGIHDVASEWGLEKHNEDFGQTFGRWGAPPGPYLVLPFLGSSTVRDGVGTAARLLPSRPAERGAADRPAQHACTGCTWSTRAPTCSTRAASSRRRRSTGTCSSATRYLQRRRSLIYDGSPPREKLE